MPLNASPSLSVVAPTIQDALTALSGLVKWPDRWDCADISAQDDGSRLFRFTYTAPPKRQRSARRPAQPIETQES